MAPDTVRYWTAIFDFEQTAPSRERPDSRIPS